ncbi:hypothetical protein TCAL_15881 [Tigriopus californicus]|uniref:Uncharacterized protein n=1 Tax=Tigriopus californicus TaxID=6832 RepID=A0A553NQV1_TIGCA|nr:uncharacterized protein LOC131879055 [Tigriopus californicus]TRY67804.1 hypothetical protein TCAL_15881 [Tigriopus californicus]
MLKLTTAILLLLSANDGDCCFGQRSQTRAADRRGIRKSDTKLMRLNSPGQRFTATHGIQLKAGQHQNMIFVVDRDDVRYMSVSANIALRGTLGAPDKYDLFLKKNSPPTPIHYDTKATVTAAESYVGSVLYSRDITIPKPAQGNYHLLLIARESFSDLLITAIMDYPHNQTENNLSLQYSYT